MDSSQEQRREHLRRVFDFHHKNICETFQLLDQPSGPISSNRVGWEEVVKMGERVSRQATVGNSILTRWNVMGRTISVAEEVEACMMSYFNELQGFLLAFYGNMVRTGPTLLSTMHESVKKVVDASFKLMKESVQAYGRSGSQTKDLSVFVGVVWEVCLALKKTPTTNITAIGRALTKTAVTMKDVLREMKELKPACSDHTTEPDEKSTSHEADTQDEYDEGSEDDIGNDLSPEEMVIAEASIDVVSETLLIVKELIRSITGLLKIECSNSGNEFVMSLEKLLKLCQEIGLQIDELGACLYPPQEVPALLTATEKITSALSDLENELSVIGGASCAFVECCGNLRSKLKHLEHELGCSQVEQQLESISLSDSKTGHSDE